MFSSLFRRATSSSSSSSSGSVDANRSRNASEDSVGARSSASSGSSPTPDQQQQTSAFVQQHVQPDFDIQVKSGGGKGWPSNVTVVYYHKLQGMICVGTEEGACHCYGDGFQTMCPYLKEQESSAVSFLSAIGADQLLVTYADNAMAIFSLPLLDLLDFVDATNITRWFGRGTEISVVYVDEPGEKSFVYVGTSEGNMFVLEACPAIRLCDYSISWAEAGLSQSMALIDIQICPKDERYLVLGFDGPSVNVGAVVMMDLAKHKVYRTYSTDAITTIAWNSEGTQLYAGTRLGDVLSVALEKQACIPIWNSASERSAFTDSTEPIVIRKTLWMPAQQLTPVGCLFILLGAYGGDSEVLKSVIVGLAPLGRNDEMREVFAIPPLNEEEVLGFRVVPTCEIEAMGAPASLIGAGAGGGKASSTEVESVITPALLLLTQTRNDLAREDTEDDEAEGGGLRQLKLLRCPNKAVSEWALEIGMLPEPRKVTEVLPAKELVSCMTAIEPNLHPFSFASVLLNKMQPDSVPSHVSSISSSPGSGSSSSSSGGSSNGSRKRMSSRAFFASNHDLTMHSEVETPVSWEMVMACAELGQASKQKRLQDVVFLGHNDGTLVAWGVSTPLASQEKGRGSIWMPLHSFKCGDCDVSAVAHDDKRGLMAAGDVLGEVKVWGVLDEQSNESMLDTLTKQKLMMRKKAQSLGTKSGGTITTTTSSESAAAKRDIAVSSLEEEEDEGDEEEEEEEEDDEDEECSTKNFRPNSTKQLLHFNVQEQVSAILLVGDAMILFVGTTAGTLFCCSDWHVPIHGADASSSSSSQMRDPINQVANLSSLVKASGAIVALHYSSFWSSDMLVPAVYVIFESGHVAILHLFTRELLAHGIGPIVEEESEEHEEFVRNGGKMSPLCCIVLDALDGAIKRPDPYDAAFLGALRDVEGRERTSTTSSVTPPPVAQKSRSMSFFSRQPPPVPSPTASGGATSNNPGGSSEEDSYSFFRQATRPASSSSQPQPPSAPKYLVTVTAHSIVSYDLSVFASSSGGSTKSSSSSLSPPASRRHVSRRPIMSAQVISYVEEAARASAEPIDCFATVDDSGLLAVHSIKTRQPICHCSLLDGIVEVASCSLTSGSILPNGNCYVQQNGMMVYAATTMSPTHTNHSPLPTPANCECHPPPLAHQLRNGREAQVAAIKSALKKRRSSMITISSGPTDLEKIFSKTRAQRTRDELFGGSGGSSSSIAEEEDDEEDTQTQASRQKAMGAMAAMAETRHALEERGEKLRAIAKKTEGMVSSSEEWRANIAEQKKKLRERNNRWGLF